MGGCATKPKDSDIRQELLPAEDSAVTTKAEGETVAQENNNEGEGQSEPPLVDLSKEEGSPHSEPKTVEAAAAVSVGAGEETAKKTEDKVEALVSESKDKAVEAGDETPEPAKEGKVEAKEEKDEAKEGKVEVKEGKDEAKEGKDEAIADKSDVAPLSDNKIDAPLVTA